MRAGCFGRGVARKRIGSWLCDAGEAQGDKLTGGCMDDVAVFGARDDEFVGVMRQLDLRQDRRTVDCDPTGADVSAWLV